MLPRAGAADTPLLLAVKSHQHATVKALIGHGAGVNEVRAAPVSCPAPTAVCARGVSTGARGCLTTSVPLLAQANVLLNTTPLTACLSSVTKETAALDAGVLKCALDAC